MASVVHWEWRLHLRSAAFIWDIFGMAEVDLYVTAENAHWPLYFSLSQSPLGVDALTCQRQSSRKYAFPRMKLLVLQKIRVEQESVLLVAPKCPNQLWFLEWSCLEFQLRKSLTTLSRSVQYEHSKFILSTLISLNGSAVCLLWGPL